MCCSLSSGGVCVSNLLPYLIRIINSISYFYEYYKKDQLGYGILKEVTLKAEKAETVFLLYFFIQSGERRLAKWTDIRI